MKKHNKTFRRIGLVANTEKKLCRDLLRRALESIRGARRTAFADKATAQLGGLDIETFASAPALAREVDLIMVFGGDGTMLRVAREVAGASTPMLGINVGSLGFLTDVPANQLDVALDQIWSGETILEQRSLIEARGSARGQQIDELALNDFVVGRGAAPRLIDLQVTVNDQVLTRYRCDGLIVCTPTGSTAYSLAAGGAVVSPSADVFTLTPICPHTLSNRSVIVSLDSVIKVTVLSERVETVFTADGQINWPLGQGDGITIKRSPRSIQLLHLAGTSFFDTLRKKLNWSGSSV